ncbi:MAG TPA: hypothetical protein VFN35_01415 [Ktedonobacteraceae bacterium]|nr:hypothetical protein [Ktedonobacteraceae bacterium]
MSSKILSMSLLGSLFLVLSIFFLYRGENWPLGVQGIEALGAFVLLLIINGMLFLYNRISSHRNATYQKSVLLGLFTGLLWVTEISINNILMPGLPARDILDDFFWAAIALIILSASILCAYQTNNIRIGLKVGFWSGFGSGAVACLTGLLLVVVGIQLLLRDPLNRIEWSARGATSETPGMAVYFAYQTLAGALLHLVVLGAIMGIVLGLLGGILGKVGAVLEKRMTAKNALI